MPYLSHKMELDEEENTLIVQVPVVHLKCMEFYQSQKL